MNELLSNPRALIAVLCVIGLVLSVNMLLFTGLRSSVFGQQAAKWGRAFGGGADVRKRQREQLDELHRRVEQLQSPPPGSDEEAT
jgi:hypothetical protein